MKSNYLFLVLLLLSNLSFSQGTLHITVTDALTKEPLPFATLYLKNSGNGTTTNFEGKAILKTRFNNDTLVCSFIGYTNILFAVDVKQSSTLNIQLNASNTKLKEVEIVYKKPFSALKILKKTLRNTTRNYSETAVNFKGLYRESMQENGKYIYINEAVVDMHYTKYVQSSIDRKEVSRYLFDEEYAFEYQPTFFDGFPNQHNTRDDKVKLIESRSSENSSLFKIDRPIGGNPLSLTAKDYIKYRNDFLNPRTLNNYIYTKKESELINGENCYVIQFHPKSTSKRVIFNHIFKNKNACYTGRLYIDKTSFALVKMEFQLLQSFDYGFYQGRIPLNYKVSVDYKKNGEKWYLNKISLEQTRNLYFRKKGFLGTSSQELFITHISKDSVHEIVEKDEWKHTILTQLRNYERVYNPDFWHNYELENYPKLSSKIKTDLESTKPLEEQFLNRFKQKENLPIPIASKEKTVHHYPLESITDYYHWFSNPDKSELFYNYLEQENEFADNYLISERKSQKRIFNNLNKFYVEDTTKVNRYFKKGDLETEKDSLDYIHLYQYSDSVTRTEIFNYDDFKAKRPKCYFTSGIKVSASNVAIQYTVNGNLNNNLIILNKDHQVIVDSISEVYSYEWFNDSLLLYSKCNDTKRSNKLFCRNTNTHKDSLLLFVKDLTFDVSIEKIKNRYISTVQSMNENEIYLADTTKLYPSFKLILPRELNVYHTPKIYNHTLYLLTNKNAPNFKVSVFENGKLTDMITLKEDVHISDFVITDNYYVLKTIHKSFQEIRYKLKSEKKWNTIEFPSKIFDASIYFKKNDVLSIGYSTPNTPFTHYTFNLTTNRLLKINQTKVKYQYANFLNRIAVDRIWAKANDGTKIPMTVLKSNSVIKSHKGLILKAYGMYGMIGGGYDFNKEDITLINDGYTVVYAHVRGGGALGSKWHLDGKLLNKTNTFNDYISCAEYLIQKKYTTSDYLVGYGVSAGGLLMGAVINKRPELFNTVILDHPYLDALTTMMMDTLPLTTDHYKEVGNPNEEDYYDYMKRYSPYHNIKKQDYPNLLFLASSNDYQTPTWQVAKYVAKVKEFNTGNSVILFKTDFGSGHIGSTFGNDWIKSLAFKNAFIQQQLFE